MDSSTASEPSLVERLVLLTTEWQMMLRLQDWNLKIVLCRGPELSNKDSVGECEWYLPRKDAIIRILHPDDARHYARHFLGAEELDVELTLVHELLHLHFAPFDSNVRDTEQEQAINAISKALVTLRRAGHVSEPPLPEVTSSGNEHPGHFV